MRLLNAVSLFLAVLPAALAFPLTVIVAANDVECFYGEAYQPGVKIGFSYAVQSGGQFDIDFKVKAPNGEVLYDQPKESQGEYSFAARTAGEYQFCFSNDMSTFSDKVVEFDLSIDSEIKATLPPSVGSGDTDFVERAITSIEERTANMVRSLQYYKTRNNRNESTVKSTENRIFWFSIFEVLLMVGMGVLHVTIVQLFFTGSRKQLV